MADNNALFETATDAIVSAIDSGDYATAMQKLGVARVYAARLPSYNVGDRGINRGDAYKQLDQLQSTIETLKPQSSARPPLFSRTRVTGVGMPR